MENDSIEPQYDPYQARADCNRTIIFCIVSVVLLIASGAVTHPYVEANIPGGAYTTSIISMVIIASVFLLCAWQCRRPQNLARMQ